MRFFFGVKLFLCVVGVAVWLAAPAYALDVSFSATASVDKVVFPQTEVVSYDVTMQNGEKPVAFNLELKGLNRSLHFGSAKLVQGEAKITDPNENVIVDPIPGYCGIGDFYNTDEVSVSLEANASATVRFSYVANREAPSVGSSYGVQVFASEKPLPPENVGQVASTPLIPAEGQYATALEVKSHPILPQADLRHGGLNMPLVKIGSSFQIYGKTTPEITGQSMDLLERPSATFDHSNESKSPDRLMSRIAVDTFGNYRFSRLSLGKPGVRQLYVSYSGDATHAPNETCPFVVYVFQPKPVDRKFVEAKIFGRSRWLHLRWQHDIAINHVDKPVVTFLLYAYERQRTRTGRFVFRKVFLKKIYDERNGSGVPFDVHVRLSKRLRKRIYAAGIAVTYYARQVGQRFRVGSKPVRVRHQGL